MANISVGIDIGTTTVTTAVVKREKAGNIKAVGVGRADAQGMRRGVVVEPEALTPAIKSSVEAAAEMSKTRVKSGVISFSGSGISTSLTRGVVAVSRADGEITREDTNRVLQAAETFHPKNANREVIHIIPREFRVDSESGIKDPVGMTGMRLEVEAVVIDGPKVALQNILKACDGSGIRVEDWLVSPLAAAEAVLSKRQKDLGVLLLDIGGGTSDYAIFEDDRIVDAGIIPIGGERVTHDIAVGFRTGVDIAEAIKIEYGHAFPGSLSKRDLISLASFTDEDQSSYSQRELSEIIQARLTDIFEVIGQLLRQKSRIPLLPAGVVLVGGSALLPGIREFAKRELRLPVERGVIQRAELAESFGAGLTLAPAIGAALWSITQGGPSGSYGLFTPLAAATSRIKNWLKIFLP